MTKLSELQKAVANRNFEHDAIDEDLEFVEDQFDAFRKYFNAVYEDICAGETAKVFLSSGRWTTEQYQDKIVSLDQNRRMAHDRAVDACKILNRMCDMHQVEHICPDKYDRATVADYVGNVMQEYYQEGLSKQRDTYRLWKDLENSMMHGEQDSMLRFPLLMQSEKMYLLKSRHMIFQSHR